MKASHTIAIQYGSKGYYAKVGLEIGEVSTVSNYTLDMLVSSPYEAGIVFGVAYSYDKVVRLGAPRGMRISIVDVCYYPVDTDNVVMACATVFAFYKALGMPLPEYPRLIKETGEIVFKK